MPRSFLGNLVLLCLAIVTAPAYAAVQEGDACLRENESSMINGKYLICTNSVWVGQAPQVVNIGLNNAVCNTANLGLLRVKNIVVLGNTLQFCDGTTWKSISLL